MGAVEFTQQRGKVQAEAEEHIKRKLADYMVETRGVYIQDVVLPEHAKPAAPPAHSQRDGDVTPVAVEAVALNRQPLSYKLG
jgi:hypothetical protein